MGLFNRFIPLLGVDYKMQDDCESAEICFKHPELKPIEFVYLAIYQFANVAFIANKASEDFLQQIIMSYSEIDKNDLPKCTNNLMKEFRIELIDKENKFTSILYFKRAIERAIKIKLPFKFSQLKLLRTIPLTIDLAYKNSDSIGKEILKVSILYQANLYRDKNNYNYKSSRNLLNVPIMAFQYGLHNSDIIIDS